MPRMPSQPTSAPTQSRPMKKKIGSSTASTHWAMKTKRPEPANRMLRPYRPLPGEPGISVLEYRFDHVVVGRRRIGCLGRPPARQHEARAVWRHIDPHHIAVVDL